MSNRKIADSAYGLQHAILLTAAPNLYRADELEALRHQLHRTATVVLGSSSVQSSVVIDLMPRPMRSAEMGSPAHQDQRLVEYIPRQLRALRASEHVSQAQLAQRMSTGQSVVSDIEGRPKELWVSTIDRYIAGLGFAAGLYVERQAAPGYRA